MPNTMLRLSLLAIICLPAIATNAFAQKGKAPPPPPPPPAPVQYRIQYWEFPGSPNGGALMDMNNDGQVVGTCSMPDGPGHGYLYDPEFNPHTAIDLDALYRAPDPILPGWSLGSADCINDRGVIVGKITDPAGVRHAYLLDTRGANQIELLPPPLRTPGSDTSGSTTTATSSSDARIPTARHPQSPISTTTIRWPRRLSFCRQSRP